MQQKKEYRGLVDTKILSFLPPPFTEAGGKKGTVKWESGMFLFFAQRGVIDQGGANSHPYCPLRSPLRG